MENNGEIAAFVVDAHRLGICIAVGGIGARKAGILRKGFCLHGGAFC
jgi:hypothetical protein